MASNGGGSAGRAWRRALPWLVPGILLLIAGLAPMDDLLVALLSPDGTIGAAGAALLRRYRLMSTAAGVSLVLVGAGLATRPGAMERLGRALTRGLEAALAHRVVLASLMLGMALWGWAAQPEWLLVHTWKLSQFHINYVEYGFVKRALVGTLLWPLPDDRRVLGATVVSAAAILFLVWSAVTALTRAQCRIERRQSVLLGVLIALSPLTFANLGFDFGRLDAVNLVLLVASLHCVHHGRAAAVVGLSILGILVHEAYLFAGAPMVLAYWLRRAGEPGNERRLPTPALFVGAVGLTTAAVFAWGRYGGAPEELAARLPHGYPSALNAWTWSLWVENQDLVSGTWAPTADNVGDIVILLALATAVAGLLLSAYRRNGIRLDAVALAPLGMLPLWVIGRDWSRWCSLFLILVLVTLVLEVLTNPRMKRPLPSRGVLWLVLTPLVAFPMGPVGVVQVFPLRRSIVDALRLLIV